MNKLRISLSFLVLAIIFSGCAIPKISYPHFLKQDRLMKRIAVVDFVNTTSYDDKKAGIRITEQLISNLKESGKVSVIPRKEVDAYIKSMGIPLPLTQSMATLVGRGLAANVVVFGSISEISLNQQKTGWMLYIPFMRSKETLSAILLARVIDVENGTFLISKAGTGNTKTRKKRSEDDGSNSSSVESSLLQATDYLSKKILKAVGTITWKGFITKVNGKTAVLNAGSDLGIRPGQKFVIFAVLETITSREGQTYKIPGEVTANLRVIKVTEKTAELEIVSGNVSPGQSVHFRK